MQSIVIATTPTGSDKLSNLLQSLHGYTNYPILIISDYSWEVGKIKFVMEHTDIDEFVLLHDSCEVKDPLIFEIAFRSDQSVAFSEQPAPFGMYLGKYQRSVLKDMIIPVAKNKMDSVNYEQSFNREYAMRAGDYDVIPNPLVNVDNFVEKFGKTCMKLENEYLIKYKATWHRSQIS